MLRSVARAPGAHAPRARGPDPRPVWRAPGAAARAAVGGPRRRRAGHLPGVLRGSCPLRPARWWPPGPVRSGAAAVTRPAQPPSLEVLAVWEAEDGRCEACGRSMDKACARTGRDKRGDRRLVCPDCKDQRPDPLATAIVGTKTAEHVAAMRGTPKE